MVESDERAEKEKGVAAGGGEYGTNYSPCLEN